MKEEAKFLVKEPEQPDSGCGYRTRFVVSFEKGFSLESHGPQRRHYPSLSAPGSLPASLGSTTAVGREQC